MGSVPSVGPRSRSRVGCRCHCLPCAHASSETRAGRPWRRPRKRVCRRRCGVRGPARPCTAAAARARTGWEPPARPLLRPLLSPLSIVSCRRPVRTHSSRHRRIRFGFCLPSSVGVGVGVGVGPSKNKAAPEDARSAAVGHRWPPAAPVRPPGPVGVTAHGLAGRAKFVSTVALL